MLTSLLLPLAMATALWVDRRFGEPPTWAHPVVAMGRYLGAFQLQRQRPALAFMGGALAWCAGAALAGLAGYALESALWLALLPWAAPWRLLLAGLLLGLLLKPLLAWRMLADEVAAVDAALAQSLDAGRAQLARLVSRDVRALDATQVREAAIETLAENLNDSVIAPLFWFVIAGLPGAALYRFANTADAMWGYRDEREWSGKWAARADDVLGWLPARLTALALLLPRLGLWPALRREAGHTPSPNSGWPMAAAALRLGLCLAKPGVYALNASGRSPQAQDLTLAIALCRRAMLGAAAALALAAWAMRSGL
jgi:adenosylcobinamide-phosphate synthase